MINNLYPNNLKVTRGHEKVTSKKALSLMQVFILVLGIVAIAYALGSEVKVVSGVIDESAQYYKVYKDGKRDSGDYMYVQDGSSAPDGYSRPAVPNPDEMNIHYHEIQDRSRIVGYSGGVGVTIRVNAIRDSSSPVLTDSKEINPSPAWEQEGYTTYEAWLVDKTQESAEEEEEKLNEVKNKIEEIKYNPRNIEELELLDDKKVKLEKKIAGLATVMELINKGAKLVTLNDNSKVLQFKDKFYNADTGDEIKNFDKTKLKDTDSIKSPSTSDYSPALQVGKNFLFAAGLLGTIQAVGTAAGQDKDKVNAVSLAASSALFVGKSVFDVVGGETAKFGFTAASNWGWSLFSVGIGIAVGAAIFYATYKDTKTEIISFTCYPWEAPTGGENCEKCNEQEIPCSAYQCRSLGQSCQLVNSEETGEPICERIHRNDIKYPIIEPWNDALSPDLKYTPDNSISPPDKGVKIIDKTKRDGCLPAFTPFTFGIKLDEPAKCKLDYTRKANFSDMQFYFGGNTLFRYNHTQSISLPSPDSLADQNITLENDGQFDLYVKCQDANGNANIANYVFRYCVDEGPDTTPPIIKSTSINTGTPIAYNQSEVDIEVYVNEPADCKWDHLDRSYDDLANEMQCSTSVFEVNYQMLYKCKATLTGLKDRQENKFYFRCKDQPTKTEDRNTNSESYEFSLIGTEPLYITDIKPNETIRGSESVVNVTLDVKTSAGYNQGQSTCYYSQTGDDDDYIMFYYKTGSQDYHHTQPLWLTAGDYTYYVKCIDLGGNYDIEKTSFTIKTDEAAPLIVRAYAEGSYLKIITDEKAKCVYDTKDCKYNFEDGISFTDIDDVYHYTDWNTEKTFYIKCEDQYQNRPNPDQCNIVIQPFKELEQKA